MHGGRISEISHAKFRVPSLLNAAANYRSNKFNTMTQAQKIKALEAQLLKLQTAAEHVLNDIERNDVVEFDDLSILELRAAALGK